MFPESMLKNHMSKENKLEAFRISVEKLLGNDPVRVSMIGIGLVFFPVIVDRHFFFLVFNLDKRSFHVIDNSVSKDYDKYAAICDLVLSLFRQHLKKYSHLAHTFFMKKKKATVMNLKWKTTQHNVDCGIFTMLHMESYMGEASTKWDCGLSVEGPVQDKQFLRLRIKFLAKMLLHDANIHCKRIHDTADEFDKTHDKEDVRKVIMYGIKQRLDENTDGQD